jgi:HEAT repeat protein/PDZ domain-containing protein
LSTCSAGSSGCTTAYAVPVGVWIPRVPSYNETIVEHCRATLPRGKTKTRYRILIGIVIAIVALVVIAGLLLAVPVMQVRSSIARCGSLDKMFLPYEEWKAGAIAEVQALGGPERAAKKLALYMTMPDSIAPKQPIAVQMLGICGDAGHARLIEESSNSSPDVRAEVFYTFGRLGNAKALPLLKQGLTDTDLRVQYAAAWSLAKIAPKSALDPLSKLLSCDNRPIATAACDLLEKTLKQLRQQEEKELYGIVADDVLFSHDFEIADRLIIVPVSISGMKYSFILDTRSSHCIVDKSFTSDPRVPLDLTIKSGTVFFKLQARLGRISLQDHGPIVCMNLELLRLATGQDIRGVIGMSVLKNYVLHVDPDRNRLLIIRHSSARKLKMRSSQPLRFSPAGLPLVKVSGRGGHVEWGVLDTGLVGSPLMCRSKAAAKLYGHGRTAVSVTEPFTPLTGEPSALACRRVPRLTIAGVEVARLVVAEGEDNLIGQAFLARCILTYDFPGKRLYVKTAHGFHAPYDLDMSGLRLLHRHGMTRVHAVDRASPAEQAGIRKGDVLSHLNGVPVADYNMWRVRSLLKARHGKKCVVTIIRKGIERTMELTLRRRL